jgi:membrane-associated protease RseP (regulator of RpoE activity)
MKTNPRLPLKSLTRIFLISSVCLVAGCYTSKDKEKEKPLLSRGWMGGHVTVVTSFPKSMIPRPKTAILISSLATNTPAGVAGLHEGDLILALDHQPVQKLRQFRGKIDPLTPGTNLVVTTWRDGQIHDYNVTVGRETFHRGGVFGIYLPLFVGSIDPWPHGDHPGWSAAVVGYQNDSVNRVELGSVKEQYNLKCDPKDTPYTEDYRIWLVFMECSKGKRIAGQELAEAAK